MFGALAYLTITTLWNALRERLRRLRQPKYLLAAIVGVAYFYYFVFGQAFRNKARGGFFSGVPIEAFGGALELIGALALLAFVTAGWIFGRDRAAVNFTEAETMFLFPAPLSRRALLNYKLLRSQIPIVLGALLLAFLFRRSTPLGAGTVMHAIGWWLILSTLNLHFIASSFMRERLLEFGLTRARRIALFGLGLAALAGVWWLAGRQGDAASAVVVETLEDYAAWLHRLLSAPPLGWLLVPFGWIVRPFLARDGVAFALALGPAVLILAAHYYWVMRSAVAFEEASIEHAATAARRVAAMRKGGLTATRMPTKKRTAAFALSAAGWQPPAFLWKSLIALGPFYRLRTWLVAVAVAIALTSWLRASPDYRIFLKVVTFLSLLASVWLLLLGPMFLRRHTGVILEQLEMTKSYPLPGWKIVLGELLTPAVLVTFAQWFLLLTMFLSLGGAPTPPKLSALFAGGVGVAAGTLLLVPPLVVMLMCIPLGSMLFFPSWSRPGSHSPGGVEAIGQGLILFFGYLIVLVVALLPAAGAGAIVYLIAHWLGGTVAAVTATLVTASAILSFEVAAVVWWLGEKLERFDLSLEMPR